MFTIWDRPSVPVHRRQSLIFQSDLSALAMGIGGDGVISGLAVSERGAGANMSVDVAAGTIRIAGVSTVFGAGANLVITAADVTYNRIDIVYAASGGRAIRTGVARINPEQPLIDVTIEVLLAQVWVPAAAASIVTADITDRRVFALSGADIDHGELQGLADDDHTQYALNTHTFVTIGNQSRLTDERALTGSASVLVTDNGAGSTVVLSVIASGVDHGGLGGLADDDHPQYLLLAGRITAQQDITKGITVSTYLRVGSASAPANTTAGDLTTTRLFVGDQAIDASYRLSQFYDSYTPGTGTVVSFGHRTIATPGAGAASDEIVSMDAITFVRPTANYAGDAVGAVFQVQHDSGAFDVAQVRGFNLQIVQNVAGTTITTARAALATYRPILGAITTAVAFDIVRGVAGDAGTIGTGTGLRIGASAGVTPTTDIAIQSLGGAHRFVGTSMFGTDASSTSSMEIRGAMISAAVTADSIRLGVEGGDPRITLENSGQTLWAIDVDASVLREIVPGVAVHSFRDTTGRRESGYVKVGSTAAAPTNTTAGDLTALRGLFGTDASLGAILHANHGTLGNEVLRLSSVATNDDPTESVFQNRAATTDATQTTLHSVTIPVTTTVLIKAFVIARRTGGTSGTADDGAAYEIQATVKNVAGVATLIGAVLQISLMEDQAGWDATIDVTGATARVRVTGATNNNVTWHTTVRTWSIGS